MVKRGKYRKYSPEERLRIAGYSPPIGYVAPLEWTDKKGNHFCMQAVVKVWFSEQWQCWLPVGEPGAIGKLPVCAACRSPLTRLPDKPWSLIIPCSHQIAAAEARRVAEIASYSMLAG